MTYIMIPPQSMAERLELAAYFNESELPESVYIRSFSVAHLFFGF